MSSSEEFNDELSSTPDQDVLAKADEFIRRRRVSLDGTASDELPREVGDDIPVLTDVVDADSLVSTPSAPTSSPQPPARDIAQHIEAWLDENLPQVVLHAMDGITDKLIKQVHASASADLLPRLQAMLEPAPVAEAPATQTPSVSIDTLPDTRVAYMRHVGPYEHSGIAALWQRFMLWCGNQGMTNPRRALYGIAQDNPELVAPEHCRYDACIAVDDDLAVSDDIGVQIIPGGRYACAEFQGTPLEISAAWDWLCDTWLADSGFALDNRPLFELYPEQWEQNAASSRFHCLLCIPVRPR